MFNNKNTSIALGVVLAMCMTAFVGVSFVSDNTDASDPIDVWQGSKDYTHSMGCRGISDEDHYDIYFNRYDRVNDIIGCEVCTGYASYSWDTVPAGIDVVPLNAQGGWDVHIYGYFAREGTYTLSVTCPEECGTTTITYHVSGSSAISFVRDYDCTGTPSGIPTANSMPSVMYFEIGDYIDISVDCECDEGITYSWSPLAPAGVSVIPHSKWGYPFHITGTWQQAGTYSLHVECNLAGCVNNVTFVIGTDYTHTVTYDANGGTGTVADTVVTDQVSGASNVTLASNGFTKSGYHFVGWKVGNTVYQPGQTVSVNGNASVTATAQWEQNTLTLGTIAKQYAVAGKSVSFNASATSNPSGATITFAKSNASSGLNVSISGNVVTCSAANAGTYTFTLTAIASGYTSSSTTVTVQVVPVLAFTNSPSAGALNA